MNGLLEEEPAPLALLIFPPVYDFALYDLFLKPYSLLRLGKWLKDSGFRVKLVNALDYRDSESRKILGKPKRDSRGTGKFFRQLTHKPEALGGIKRNYSRYGIVKESLQEKIKSEKPDIVFVSTGMTYWYPGVVEAVRIVKHFFPQTPVVIGGIYSTVCTGHARKYSEADFVVAGDAFPQVRDILRNLSLPHSPEDLPEELLLLPEGPDRGSEAVPDCGVIRLNEGCPFRCKYCSSYVLHSGFQTGNPASVFNTVLEMNRLYGTSSFAFYDDALLAGKEKGIIPFLELVIASPLNLSFYLPNAVHLCFLDTQLARLMKEAGFREVRLGFESSMADFHISMDQKLLPQMLEQGLEHLFSAGFLPEQIGVYVLAGLPGQYREEVEESILYVAALGIKAVVAEYSPVPGSLLWDQSVRLSRFPLSEEPLTHNNSIFPMQWEGFNLEDLNELKALARTLWQSRLSD